MKVRNRNVNREFKDSAFLNSETYIDFLERLKQVAISQFKWVNLPKSMNSDYLERCLYEFGKASLLKTKKYGFINSKCVGNSDLNIYMLPTSINCFSSDMLSEDRKLYNGFINETEDEYGYAILVKNNPYMIPTEPTLRLFAKRLYEAERTSDVNVMNQKTPWILVGDESLKLALKNLYLKVTGNEPVVYGDKNQIGMDTIKCIKTDTPFLADKLMEYKKEIWNEALTYLGINNINVEKKERLVKDEASSNNELINLNLQARLSCRKKACEEFNELFNLSGEDKIDVILNSDLENVVKKYESVASKYLNPDEGGESKDE